MEKQKDTSGSNDSTSGELEAKKNESSYSPEFVEKLKKEKLNTMKALEELKATLALAEQDKLKEKEQWKTLYEQQKKSNEELATQLQQKEERIRQGVLNSAISNELLKLGVDPTMMDAAKQLFDKNAIMFDETNTPIGVSEAAQAFYKKYSTLNIFKRQATANHSAAAMNGSAGIDWKKAKTPEEKVALFKKALGK